jgi:hypothetical protein
VKYNRVFDLPMTQWLVAQTEFTMDAGESLEAFEVCRVERG